MAEERTITVTLESGGQPPNPVITQPPGGYGPPQTGFAIPPQQQGGYGPPPAQGNYGIQPVVNPPTQPGYGGYQPPTNGAQPVVNPPTQPGYGGYQPPTNGAHPMGGVQPPPGHNVPPGVRPTGGYNAPSNDNWMMRPQGIPNCPPGLEYLTTIDTLIVNQIFNSAQAMADQEPENEYVVTNSIGQKMYYVKEESDHCSRKFCGSRRAFRMKVFDNFGHQVISLSRPIACQACCFPCCLQKMEVSAPPGTIVGHIDQEWAFLHPTFAIKGPTGDIILRIQGPWCTMNCYADVNFKVLTVDGANEVGKISKKWSGYSNENSAKMDVFGISFPMDLDVHMKAVMLGACFLIDMMYFEQSAVNPNRSNTQQNTAPQHQELKPV